jgi:hypothetical protein
MGERGGHRRTVWARRSCALEMGRASRLGAAGSGSERVRIGVWIWQIMLTCEIRRGACLAARVRWGGEHAGRNPAQACPGCDVAACPQMPMPAGRRAARLLKEQSSLWSLRGPWGRARCD